MTDEPKKPDITLAVKVGWFAIGFFCGPIGLLILFLIYRFGDIRILITSIRFALYGIAAEVATALLLLYLLWGDGWLAGTVPSASMGNGIF